MKIAADGSIYEGTDQVAWQWDAANSGMTPTTTGAGIYLTGSATTTAFIYTGNGSAAVPSYTFTNDIDTGLFSAATNQLGLTTAGSEALRIDTSGNVGIGTTSPDVLLHLESTSASGQFDIGYDWDSYANFKVDSNGDLTIDLNTVSATTTIADNLKIQGNTIFYDTSATSTIPNNAIAAWTLATSTSISPLFKIDTTNGGLVTVGGSGSGSVTIGDVGSASNLIFEESSTIHAGGEGNTLTFGTSGDFINFVLPYRPDLTQPVLFLQ